MCQPFLSRWEQTSAKRASAGRAARPSLDVAHRTGSPAGQGESARREALFCESKIVAEKRQENGKKLKKVLWARSVSSRPVSSEYLLVTQVISSEGFPPDARWPPTPRPRRTCRAGEAPVSSGRRRLPRPPRPRRRVGRPPRSGSDPSGRRPACTG